MSKIGNRQQQRRVHQKDADAASEVTRNLQVARGPLIGKYFLRTLERHEAIALVYIEKALDAMDIPFIEAIERRTKELNELSEQLEKLSRD